MSATGSFPSLLQELAAMPDADGKALVSFENGEYHLVIHVKSELHRIAGDNYEDVVVQTRQFLADLRGERLDADDRPAAVLNFSTFRRRRDRRPPPYRGGDDAA